MRILPLVSFVFVLLATSLAAESPVPDRRLALERDVDYPGGDIRSIFDTTLEACEKACLADPNCTAFTYNSRSNACFPKRAVEGRELYEGAFSGRVLNTNLRVIALGEVRAAELDFLTDNDFDRAKSVALDLTNRHIPGGWTIEGALQRAAEARLNGNIVLAYRFTGAATVLSDAPDHWTEYARLALAIETNNSSERSNYRYRALMASINGYLRADSAPVQANALMVMAEALEANSRSRLMIPALRLALSLSPRQDIEDALDEAIGKYGFRVVEHTVDNDAARPRICAEFSEALVMAGVDYAPFVQVPDAELTVEPDARQLCVEGVTHGERYRVTFRD